MLRWLIDDFGKRFAAIASMGGIECCELCRIEVAFLQLIGWDVWADPIELFLVQENMLAPAKHNL